MRATLAYTFILLALAAAAEKQPLERYQTIIDRQMFGPLPSDFDPAKMPSEVAKTSQKGAKELSKEQEELKKAVHFSVLNRRQTGEIEVGFSDLAEKDAPKHYFLKVGESQDGWKVESADVDSATVTLEKDGVVLDLTLGDNSAKGGGSSKKSDSSAAGAGARRATLFGTAKERRRRQQEEQRAKDEQTRKAEMEAEREKMRADFQTALANVKRELEEKAEERKAEQQRLEQEQQARGNEENDSQ